MATSTKQVQQVRDLIKVGKKNQAVSRLAVLIERDHDNPELWWLLANATNDTAQARQALEELLGIRPNDERARRMLDRLDTRERLQMMGIERSKSVNSNRRVKIFAGFTAAAVTIVALVIVAALVSNTNSPESTDVASVPTLMEFPTENTNAVAEPQDPVETIETEEPPDATPVIPGLDSIPRVTDPLPVQTQEIVAPVVEADDPEIQPEITVEVQPPAPGASDDDVTETTGPNFRVPSTTNPELLEIPVNPESTAEPTPPLNSRPPAAVNPDTSEDNVNEEVSRVEPAVTGVPVDVRGQVVEGTPVRQVIQPYGEHAWTFSGYRDEQITLDLKNQTGEGNPSLELRDADGYIIAQDIDVVSGNNTDAVISLALPSDGIYTVVVRMAAVDEQLYYLILQRS